MDLSALQRAAAATRPELEPWADDFRRRLDPAYGRARQLADDISSGKRDAFGRTADSIVRAERRGHNGPRYQCWSCHRIGTVLSPVANGEATSVQSQSPDPFCTRCGFLESAHDRAAGPYVCPRFTPPGPTLHGSQLGLAGELEPVTTRDEHDGFTQDRLFNPGRRAMPGQTTLGDL